MSWCVSPRPNPTPTCPARHALRTRPYRSFAQSVIGTWAYVSAALAIAAGAVLVDSFRDADRMRGKLEGRMGCGGDAAGGGDFCCGECIDWCAPAAQAVARSQRCGIHARSRYYSI